MNMRPVFWGTFIVCFAVTSFVQPDLYAHNYYVRKTGNDKNDGKSKGKAFRTLEKAFSTATYGDNVYVGSGTYEEVINVDGPGTPPKEKGKKGKKEKKGKKGKESSSPSTWIRYYADLDGKKTGDQGPVVVRVPAKKWGIAIKNIVNFSFSGFTFQGYSKTDRTANGCRIQNTTGLAVFTNCKFEYLSYGIHNETENSISIANCHFEINKYGFLCRRTVLTEIDNSQFLGDNHSIQVYDSDKIDITNCLFTPSSDTALTAKYAYPIRIYRSEAAVHDCRFVSSHTCVYGSEVSKIDVLRCEFDQSRSYGVQMTGTNISIQESNFYDGGYGCYLRDTAGKSVLLKDVRFENLVSAAIVVRGGHHDFQGVDVIGNTKGIDIAFPAVEFTLDKSSDITFSKNRFAIYGYTNKSNRLMIKISDQTIQDNDYCLHVTGIDVDIKECVFEGNGSGPMIINSNEAKVQSCNFISNNTRPKVSAHGLYLKADDMSVRDCVINDHKNGLSIINTSTKKAELKDLQINGNLDKGLYIAEGIWVWNKNDNIHISNSMYGVRAYHMQWTIDGVEMDDTNRYALMDDRGDWTIRNSIARGERIGFYGYMSSSLKIFDSEVYGVANEGVYIYRCGNVEIDGLKCIDNPRTGVYCNSDGSTSLQLNDLFISGCKYKAMNLSRIGINPSVASNITLTDNKEALSVSYADVTITSNMNVSLSKNTFGLALRYGNATLTDVVIEDNDYSVYVLQGGLDVTGSEFSGKYYGILVYPIEDSIVSLKDIQIRDSKYGIYLYGYSDKVNPIYLEDIRIDDSSHTGLYIRKRKGDDPKVFLSDCTIRGGKYGIYALQADLEVQSARIENCTSSGILSQYGSTKVVDSTIQGTNGWAISASGIEFELSRSRLLNSRYGLLMQATKGRVVNSVINGGGYGVVSNKDTGTQEVFQTTIANITSYGIAHYKGNTIVRNSIITSSGNALWDRSGVGSFSHDHNVVYSSKTAYKNTVPGIGEINKDPIFENVAAGDLRLASGSPAINAGTDLSSVSIVDIDGNARPSFRRFEIGAFEYDKPSGSLRILGWDEKAK